MKALVAWVLLALASALGLYLQSLSHQVEVSRLQQEHAHHAAAVANAAADAIAAQVAQHERQASRVAELDTQYTEELAHAERENQRLRAAVAAGERRLYINATCSASGDGVHQPTGTTSVDDAARRAELDPVTAARIITLTDRGDRAIQKLSACQSYVRIVTDQN